MSLFIINCHFLFVGASDQDCPRQSLPNQRMTNHHSQMTHDVRFNAKSYVSYCTSFLICGCSFGKTLGCLSFLPGCFFCKDPSGGATKMSPLLFVRRARMSPSLAKTRTVSSLTPIRSAISGTVSIPAVSETCGGLEYHIASGYLLLSRQ